MASANPSNDSSTFVDFDEFVNYQLTEVKSAVRSADITIAVIGSLAWIGFLALLFVVSDQWLFVGGWSPLARWCWGAILFGGLGYWLTKNLLHPALRKVSPLYAAQELESAVPELRRNLVNLVDLQSAGRPISPSVLKTLQKRAAFSLEQIQPRQAVNHQNLIRAAYILLGAVVLLAIYAIFSPKPIWPSLWRMIPFTSTVAPTRTVIVEVYPGSTHVLSGNTIEVHAVISGQIPDEVLLKFTTQDRQFVDESVRLVATGQGGTRFEGQLIGERGEGLTQSVSYYVVAGDTRSETFQIAVTTPPHANIDEVLVVPPPYTQLAPVTSRGGAIHAWAGSQVSIHAGANRPITSATMIFFDDDGVVPTGEEIPARLISPTEIQVAYSPNLRQDGTYPRHYALIVRTTEGDVDPTPTVYPISLLIDQGPEVRLMLPEKDLAAAANATIPFVAIARDPDFLLGPITLIVEKQGQIIAREEISPGGEQEMSAQTSLRLDRYALNEGDELRVYATAADNFMPTPHVSRSDARRILIQGILQPKEQKAQEQQVQQQAQQAQQQLDKNIEERRAAAAGESGEDTPQPNDNNAMRDDQAPQDQAEGNPAESGQSAGSKAEGQPSGKNSNESGNQNGAAGEMSRDQADNDAAPNSSEEKPSGNESTNQSLEGTGQKSSDRNPKSDNSSSQKKPSSQQSGSEAGDNASQDQTGEGAQNQKPGTNQQNSGQKPSGNNSGNKAGEKDRSAQSQPEFSPNGEDDSAVLERLLKDANRQPPQPPKSNEAQNEKSAGDDASSPQKNQP